MFTSLGAPKTTQNMRIQASGSKAQGRDSRNHGFVGSFYSVVCWVSAVGHHGWKPSNLEESKGPSALHPHPGMYTSIPVDPLGVPSGLTRYKFSELVRTHKETKYLHELGGPGYFLPILSKCTSPPHWLISTAIGTVGRQMASLWWHAV